MGFAHQFEKVAIFSAFRKAVGSMSAAGKIPQAAKVLRTPQTTPKPPTFQQNPSAFYRNPQSTVSDTMARLQVSKGTRYADL